MKQLKLFLGEAAMFLCLVFLWLLNGLDALDD